MLSLFSQMAGGTNVRNTLVCLYRSYKTVCNYIFGDKIHPLLSFQEFSDLLRQKQEKQSTFFTAPLQLILREKGMIVLWSNSRKPSHQDLITRLLEVGAITLKEIEKSLNKNVKSLIPQKRKNQDKSMEKQKQRKEEEHIITSDKDDVSDEDQEDNQESNNEDSQEEENDDDDNSQEEEDDDDDNQDEDEDVEEKQEFSESNDEYDEYDDEEEEDEQDDEEDDENDEEEEDDEDDEEEKERGKLNKKNDKQPLKKVKKNKQEIEDIWKLYQPVEWLKLLVVVLPNPIGRMKSNRQLTRMISVSQQDWKVGFILNSLQYLQSQMEHHNQFPQFHVLNDAEKEEFLKSNNYDGSQLPVMDPNGPECRLLGLRMGTIVRVNHRHDSTRVMYRIVANVK